MRRRRLTQFFLLVGCACTNLSRPIPQGISSPSHPFAPRDFENGRAKTLRCRAVLTLAPEMKLSRDWRRHHRELWLFRASRFAPLAMVPTAILLVRQSVAVALTGVGCVLLGALTASALLRKRLERFLCPHCRTPFHTPTDRFYSPLNDHCVCGLRLWQDPSSMPRRDRNSRQWRSGLPGE